jgi:hypothetical protein
MLELNEGLVVNVHFLSARTAPEAEATVIVMEGDEDAVSKDVLMVLSVVTYVNVMVEDADVKLLAVEVAPKVGVSVIVMVEASVVVSRGVVLDQKKEVFVFLI